MPVRTGFSRPICTSHGAHTASYIMGTRSFPEVKLRKECSYTSTSPLYLHGKLGSEYLYLSRCSKYSEQHIIQLLQYATLSASSILLSAITISMHMGCTECTQVHPISQYLVLHVQFLSLYFDAKLFKIQLHFNFFSLLGE
jgi:hypothetical protein